MTGFWRPEVGARGQAVKQPKAFPLSALITERDEQDVIVRVMVNASGAAVQEGSVVTESTTANGFTTSTTQGAFLLGVLMETVPNGNPGRVAILGTVKRVRAASGVTAGQHLRQSTTAGVVEGVDEEVVGMVGCALTAYDSSTGMVEAIILPHSSGDHAGAVRTVARTSALTRTSTTLSADSLLTLPVEAGFRYELLLCLFYQALTAADLRMQLVGPASTDGIGTVTYLRRGDSIETSLGFRLVGVGSPVLEARGIVLGKRTVAMTATFEATAGSLAVHWCSKAGGQMSLLEGSMMRLTEMAN